MVKYAFVPNPTTGERMRVHAVVTRVPCPQCRAPLGVPCRGSRWQHPTRTGRGGGNCRWWWRDTHVTRKYLDTAVRRGKRYGALDLHEAMLNATLDPVDTYGHPVDVDENNYAPDSPEPRYEPADPLEDRDDGPLQQVPKHPVSLAGSE